MYASLAFSTQVKNTVLAFDCDSGPEYRLIMNRLRDLREAIGLSQARLAELAGTTQPTVYRLESSQRKLSKKWAEALAPHLRVTPQELMFDDSVPALTGLRVEGISRAGQWLDITLMEDDESDREVITAARDQRYPHAHQYALKVAGDSMNLRFPDGCYVICAAWPDIGLDLKPGMVLHVERHTAAHTVETTIKKFAVRGGCRYLDPESDNPHWKPIALTGGDDIEVLIKGLVISKFEPISY